IARRQFRVGFGVVRFELNGTVKQVDGFLDAFRGNLVELMTSLQEKIERFRASSARGQVLLFVRAERDAKAGKDVAGDLAGKALKVKSRESLLLAPELRTIGRIDKLVADLPEAVSAQEAPSQYGADLQLTTNIARVGLCAAKAANGGPSHDTHA